MRAKRAKTSKYIAVKESPIHSNGVFARSFIRKGTRIIEYVGEKITKRESDRRAQELYARHRKDRSCGAVYIFRLNRWHDVDGDVPYNTARLINHSCDPNCETDIIRDRIWIIATRDIKKGEEITYNYGYDLEEYEDHPCNCRTERCVGYIAEEDLWPKLKKLLANRRQKKSWKQKSKNN